MESQKLKLNINKLGKMIPSKGDQYTPDFPKSIAECLQKYLRQSTLWNIQGAAWIYEKEGWPLPFFVDPNNIQVGRLHQKMLDKFRPPNYKHYFTLTLLRVERQQPIKKKRSLFAKLCLLILLPIVIPFVLLKRLYLSIKKQNLPELLYYDWFNAAIIGQWQQVLNIDDLVIDLFETNFEYYKLRLTGNLLLSNKTVLLKDIFETYENKNYGSCICTLYPILDFITRQVFDTNKLDRDITKINSIFTAAGFTLDEIDNLKPAGKAVKIHALRMQKKLTYEEYLKLATESAKDPNLGLPGVALSSFLHFGTKYYAYYRNDSKTTEFNRHAIMHGASDEFANKANCVKLFTYLYLMIELEPVLRIVFNDR